MAANHAPVALPRPAPRPVQPMAPEVIRFAYQAERPVTAGTGHFHWTIVAFSEYDRERGQFLDSVSVEVEGPDEQAAIARAMTILVRAYYRVASVREACSADVSVRGQ